MTRLLDRTSVAFTESAKKFFNKKFPNSTLNFKEKSGGTRSGIVVTVTCDRKDTTYFMKTFHQAGTSGSYSSMKRHPPDLREMFAYRLLQIIGVGPVVFFPYYEGSTTILTEKVKEFTEVDKIEDVALQKKVVVESYLLSLILGIRDLNIGNIGSNQQKDLAIVDFCVTNGVNFVERKIVNNFLNKNNFDVPDISHDTLANIGHEERMKIAKDALAKWSQISTITSDIIGDEKRELRKHGIVLGNATDDVESYIEDIKLNYDSIFLASR
ncbi:hypothetical protein CRE_02671 [Caenorhabditis remanei]|uniref:Uncharacterized protein n=1 Tax=Caenorhabditis remanei TaxID=31234 RepID=E3NHX3_CAERE|nr:hypothetical protein CRE_02671 [Caenorhabditis remanei]